MTVTSFAITMCGQWCRHFVGQRVVSDISVVSSCWSICSLSSESNTIMLVCNNSCGARNFHSGAKAQGGIEWGPVGFRGEAPVGGPEDEAVCRHCLQIFTAETIKIWKFRRNHLLILTIMFHGRERDWATFGNLAP